MLLIYTPNITPRGEYIMQYVFGMQFGIPYKLISDEHEFINIDCPEKIVYSTKNINHGLYFFSHLLLFENDIKEFDVAAGKINNVPVLFKHETIAAIEFDVFAAIFYLISRYEEYLHKPTDKFGNFDFNNSILYQLNCLNIPVVEQWMKMLKEILQNNFPSLQFKKGEPHFALSFDIDVAYAYQNRSVVRIAGGFIKKLFALNFPDFIDQLLTVLHLKKDMFDTYAYIFSAIKNKKAIFFFNMGSYAQFDKNPHYKNKKFQELIRQIHKKYNTGLHPSYASNTNYSLLREEKIRLEKITEQTITSSRQHYLKLKFPETYRQLIKNKITTDFTLGYHDTYGFRAGTCKPFLFFDVENNVSTQLQLLPFAIMEGTLDDVMKLDVQTSKKIMSGLISEVCKHEGIFIPLWHNSTLCTKQRREIFEHMLHEIENKMMKDFFS